MSNILIFDSETCGMPLWREQSGDPEQPHIVQLAAVLVDEETKEISQSIDLIVKPDGWIIPDDTIEVHGITNEMAHDVGIPEYVALGMFLSLWNGRKQIAYNTTFDRRIIRIATKRYSSESMIDSWKEGEYECAMQASRKVMGGKVPKLEAAYKHFTGKEIQNAHTAMGDTLACMEIFFAVKEANQAAA